MADDVAGMNRAARLHTVPNATVRQRQQARRWCATQALTRAPGHEHAALAELLAALDLNPQEGEPT